MRFFETLAWIHRDGESVPFAGMKPVDVIGPIGREADKALEVGSAGNLTTEMSQHLIGGVKNSFFIYHHQHAKDNLGKIRISR